MKMTIIQPAMGIPAGPASGCWSTEHTAIGKRRRGVLFYGLMECVRSPFQTYSVLCTNETNKIAGAGKTKLISVVVNSLRRDLEKSTLSRREAMAYFYCDRNKDDRRNNSDIFRSLVRQLSTPWDGDSIPTSIDDCFAGKEKHGFPSTSLTFRESAVLVHNLLKGYTKVTIILDALDECDESSRHLLIDELDKLVSEPSSCVLKVLISSRPDKDIKYRFEGGPNVCIKATDNQEDIKTFLTNAIRPSPGDWKRTVTSCPGLEDEIVNTLHQKADGMYAFSLSDYSQFIFPTYFQVSMGETPDGRASGTIICGRHP